jgi:transcription termination factor Rho
VEAEQEEADRTVEGVVELLANGSGFVRVSPPEPSDDDVYISAAQVRRCELVSGDVIAGPVRRPRRSERFPSLVRIETINGAPADEVAEGTRYEELPAVFPSSRFALASDDPTLKAIEWLTPFGRGSRVTLAGPTRSGKTEALRRLAQALAATDGAEVFLVLAGARPEEVAEWGAAPVPVTATAPLGTSADTQEQTIQAVVEQGRRLAARGGDAVVLIDSLDGLAPTAARRALAAARNIADGGSLTVIATATEPLGGETTVIAFDARLASARRFPAIDVATSGTMRPELLVGEAGAEAIARARSEVYG